MSLPIESALSARGELADGTNWEQLGSDPESPESASRTDSAHELAEFFETVAPQAKRFAMSMTRRWCLAEELVQEAFLRLAQATQPSETKSIRSKKSYLFATIRNLAIDAIRKTSRHTMESRELDSVAGPQTNQQHQLQQLESAIANIINAMQHPLGDALRLKINGDLTYAEIAEVLNATSDQVRGWIFRGRKKLANELRQQGLLEP